MEEPVKVIPPTPLHFTGSDVSDEDVHEFETSFPPIGTTVPYTDILDLGVGWELTGIERIWAHGSVALATDTNSQTR